MKGSLVPVGNCKLVKLLLLSYLALAVTTQTGLPPRNVTISWIDYFFMKLSWIPPQNGNNCTYVLILNGESIDLSSLTYSTRVQLNKGFMEISLSSLCDQIRSDPVKRNITYPVLVRDFQCSLVSSSLTDCTWNTALNVTDLRFFVWPVNEDPTENPETIKVDLKECTEYQYIEGTKSGCHQQGNFLRYVLYVLLNGTLDNEPVNNTFEIRPRYNIRLPALNWTVTEIDGQLEIEWIPPDLDSVDWTYTINYTECEEKRSVSVTTCCSKTLPVNPHCQYRISIQGKVGEPKIGETLWTTKVYGVNKNPDEVMHTVFIVITVIVIVAALTIVCLRKHKEKIFPKVPEPPISLKEMLNKPMVIVGELCTPVQEEQNNKISLIVDQQSTTLPS